MKTLRSGGGPFRERPHFSDLEIDQMCEDALRRVGLLPTTPEPVRIERFIEKYFGVTPIYEEMDSGVLGYTTFCAKGVKSIHIAAALQDGSQVNERRLNSTLAHEAGHGLMHAYLFAFEEAGLSMFGGDRDVSSSKVLCRDETPSTRSGFDGRWWELQANKAIGSLLLPRQALSTALAPFLERGIPARAAVLSSQRDDAATLLSERFDVNPIVCRIRMDSLYPSEP